MLADFDLNGRRHRAQVVAVNSKTVRVRVAYHVTRVYSLGTNRPGWPKNYGKFELSGDKVIIRHLRKHNVRILPL